MGRAGRFGTKGLGISFVSSEGDQKILAEVQSRFEVSVPVLPDQIDVSAYSKPLLVTSNSEHLTASNSFTFNIFLFN